MSAGCPHRRGPRARTPARVIGMSARCPHRRALLTLCMGYRHRRALLTPARVISPSRCQQPPHDVNDPLTVPTTRVRIDNVRSNSHPGRQRASTPKGGAPAPGPGALRTRSTWTRPATPTTRGDARTRAGPRRTAPDRAPPPRGTHTRTPILRNTNRTQGRNQALVCGPVLSNSLPCVRHRGGRMLKAGGSGPVGEAADPPAGALQRLL